jgi:hypothetical protein
MTQPEVRWWKGHRRDRLWLVLDGEITRYYTSPGYGDWPHALYERLPSERGVWAYRRVVGFRTWAALAAWVVGASAAGDLA